MNAPRKICAVVLVLSLFSALVVGAAEEPLPNDNPRLLDSRPRLSPLTVRNFILQSFESEPKLQHFYELNALRDSLPSFYYLFTQGEWPNKPVVVTGIYYPYSYLKLGEWQLVFGKRYLPIKPKGLEQSPFVLQAVRLIKTKYFVDDSPTEMECTEIRLEVVSSGTEDDWKNGRIEKLELAGWKVLIYRKTDHGSYEKEKLVRVVAAGGSLKELEGTSYDSPLPQDALVGHVEKWLPPAAAKAKGP